MARNLLKPGPMIAICCGLAACGLSAQQENPGAAATAPPYMGEALPKAEAVIFAPGTVSVAGRYEYAMSIHPSGDRMLFTVEVPGEGAAVFMSRVEGGSWIAPERVSLTAGARKNEMEAFFSADGRSLFFAPYDEGIDVRIWMANLTAEGWDSPRPVGPPMDQDPAFYPVQDSEGTLYYTNLAQRAVYRATLDNATVVTAAPAGLAAGGHAFPAPDGSYILVDSASLNSDAERDIFVAFRAKDGSWGSLQPLGPAVNTDHSETCPSLSPDGSFMFFSRYNEPGDISNIYWISSEVVREQIAPSISRPSAAANDLDHRVQVYLDAHRGSWSGGFPDGDGQLLYDLILENGYTRVVEIGTGTGHSAIWLAWALSKTGGKLTTIEINGSRCREASARFEEVGLSDLIDVRCADALEVLPKLQRPFEFVFMDAPIVMGTDFFEAAAPKLVVGGRYVSHGIRGGEPWEYVRYLEGLTDFETTFDTGGHFCTSRKMSEH